MLPLSQVKLGSFTASTIATNQYSYSRSSLAGHTIKSAHSISFLEKTQSLSVKDAKQHEKSDDFRKAPTFKIQVKFG